MAIIWPTVALHLGKATTPAMETLDTSLLIHTQFMRSIQSMTLTVRTTMTIVLYIWIFWLAEVTPVYDMICEGNLVQIWF
jgi:hypothetical protein